MTDEGTATRVVQVQDETMVNEEDNDTRVKVVQKKFHRKKDVDVE